MKKLLLLVSLLFPLVGLSAPITYEWSNRGYRIDGEYLFRVPLPYSDPVFTPPIPPEYGDTHYGGYPFQFGSRPYTPSPIECPTAPVTEPGMLALVSIGLLAIGVKR